MGLIMIQNLSPHTEPRLQANDVPSPPPSLFSLSPSPLGTLWTHSRLPHAYLFKMVESALVACAKIRPPCMLKQRLHQEYNSLLVNALNCIVKSNLSLNNFKWLLTKLELLYIRNIIPRSRKHLWNGYHVLNQELQNHDPVGRHTPVWVKYGILPPPHLGYSVPPPTPSPQGEWENTGSI